MKYRKKPVVIEAVQIAGVGMGEAKIFGPMPDWLERACGVPASEPGSVWVEPAKEGRAACLMVSTMEGSMRAEPGSWIIRGVEGEIYPCADSVFQATYELVSEVEA